MRFDRHPSPTHPPSGSARAPHGGPSAVLRAALGAALLPLLLLVACSGGVPAPPPVHDEPGPAGPAVDAEPPPDAIARVADSRGGHRLLEGARSIDGQRYPDGRVYLESAGGAIVALTPRSAFGEHFFADALALLPEPGAAPAALVAIARSDGAALYRVAPGAAPRRLLDLAALGGLEPIETSVRVSADGRTVAFAARGAVAAPWSGPAGAQEGYALELSVWRFDPRAADPAATLERLLGGAELERLGYDPGSAPPRLDVGPDGRVEVAPRDF